MKNWNIRTTIIALALLPGVLLSIVLGSYFVYQRSMDLNLLLDERAQALAKQLASTSEFGMATGNKGLLQNLANDLLEENDVRAVNLYNPDMILLAKSGPIMLDPLKLTQTNLNKRQLQVSYTSNSIRIKAPVYPQALSISDQVSDDFFAAPPTEQSLKIIGWAEVELTNTTTRLLQYKHILVSTVIVLGILILTSLFALRISRRITKPVITLITALDEIRSGKYEQRIHTQDTNELKSIVQGVNALAAALQQNRDDYQHELELQNRESQETIDELEVQNRELDISRKQALEANKIKSEFLANVSHEIRTPLNAIIGFADVLKNTRISERQSDSLSNIRKSSNDLLKIISDLLDLSKIDAGKLTIDNERYNLRDLLEEAEQTLAIEAAKKRITLVHHMDKTLPEYYYGDPLRLKQVLINLISNAVKFTDDGDVTIRVYPLRQANKRIRLQFDITDTGIGMDEEQSGRLFQSFSQADASITRKYGGTGLGLVISKAIIEAMNGSISHTSTPGKGTTFSFTLEAGVAPASNIKTKHLEGSCLAIIGAQPDWRADISGLIENWGAKVKTFTDLSAFNKQANKPDFDTAILHLGFSSSLPDASLIQPLKYSCTPVLVLTSGDPIADIKDDCALCKQVSSPVTQNRLLKELLGLLKPEASEIHSQQRVSQPYQPPTVLVVDDNELNLKLVCTFLKDLGAHVVEAKSGFEAVTLAEREKLDLILMDIQMPGMSGIEATQHIRKNPKLNELPIVALTAYATANERQELLNSGLDDYRTKPITQDELAKTLERWTNYQKPDHTNQSEYLAYQENQNPIFSAAELLSQLNQNIELATETFSGFLQGLQSQKKRIIGLWEDESLDELLEAVHYLHGAIRYLGTPNLRSSLTQFEHHLKTNQVQHFPQDMKDLITAIEALQEWVKENDWQSQLRLAKPF